MNKKKFLFFISLFIFSCSVGPDYKKVDIFSNDEIQKSLNLKNGNVKDLQNLIFQFNDPVLNQLIKDALINNNSIKIAVLKLRQARDLFNITYKNGFPTFNLMAQYNYVDEPKNMQYLINNDYYQFGIDMSWEIDIFGKTRRQAEASKAEYRAMIENLKNVNVSLISEVALQYINLRMAEQNLKNMRENLLLQQDAYDILSEKYAVDLVDEVALNQSRYLLENMKMQIPSLEYQREIYANSLAILVGKLPGEIDELLNSNNSNLVNRIFNYDVNNLYNLQVDVIRNRPDVKMAEEKLIAQNANLGVAVANVYPSFNISAFLGFQSLHSSNLFDEDSLGYSIVPGVLFPLFHFSQLRNNIKLEEGKKEEAFINYQQVLLSAIGDLKNSIVAVEKEYQRNISAVMAYQKMSEVSSIMWEKYLMGLVEYSDVLNSEQNRLKAQTNMINSNANIYKSIIAFYKAIGGGIYNNGGENIE